MEDFEASLLALDSSGHSVATFVSDDEETKSTSDQVLAMMISSFSSDCGDEEEEMSADQFASISSESPRVIRNGSTKSPVCVSSFVDKIVKNDFWEDDDFGNKSILNNIDDETMDFVDPDKLEEAISKLCDPILEKKSQQGTPLFLFALIPASHIYDALADVNFFSRIYETRRPQGTTRT